MKRYLALFLALLLLLGGCTAKKENSSTEVPSTETPDKENLSVFSEEGVLTSNLSDWNYFRILCAAEESAKINIHRSYDGVTYTSVLSYDGEVYTLTEEDSVRSYKHLIYTSQLLPSLSSYDFAEYFLLSDDPEMTYERYFEHMVSSVLQEDFPATTIVLSDYLDFDRAESFGTVMGAFSFIEYVNLLQHANFGQDGFYIKENFAPYAEGFTATTSRVDRLCYTYEFEPLPVNSLPEESGFCKGYYEGRQILDGDKLFKIRKSDRLPEVEGEESLSDWGIIPYESGYIVVRAHNFGYWKHQNPLAGYRQSYRELILTAYDADGTAIWQITGDIFVG